MQAGDREGRRAGRSPAGRVGRGVLAGLCALALGACGREPPDEATAPMAAVVEPGAALAAAPPDPSLPRLQAYRAQIAEALTQSPPILRLPNLEGVAARAQDLALGDPGLAARVQTADGAPLRLQVFSVHGVRETDLGPAHAACAGKACQRVEIYDFHRNEALVVIVDPDAGTILARGVQVDTQPEIPDALKDVAIELAIHAPEVAEALGGAPAASEALMASTRTALNQTRCERSRHLCVAPTFVSGNVAVWAIVDLTALQLVGVRWTDLGRRDDPPPTEAQLQDAVVERELCEQTQQIDRDGWTLRYGLTSSDGLQVMDVRWNGVPVIDSIKLVDWHVSYSEREGFGYSDAVGCPTFSSAAVIPHAPATVRPLGDPAAPEGFLLEQEFRSQGWPLACSYSYRQGVAFYRDGRVRPTMTSIGAGCGNDGTYRPVLRIAPAGADWSVQAVGEEAATTAERWFAPEGPVDADGVRLRLTRPDGQLDLIDGRGQFGDGGRGDSAYWYLTRRQAGQDSDEGESDLLTLGSCCNADHRQGPEVFINDPPEPLGGQPVLWYVAQLKNDDRPGQEYCWARQRVVDGVARGEAYPCTAGPLLRFRAP